MTIQKSDDRPRMPQEEFNNKTIQLGLLLTKVLEDNVPKLFSENLAEGGAAILSAITFLKSHCYKSFIASGTDKSLLLTTQKKENKMMMRIILNSIDIGKAFNENSLS